jgi:hypothetical protein
MSSALRARDVDIVVLDDRLRSDPRFRDDPEFARFDAARGESDGFVFIPVEGTRLVLGIRSDRRPRAPDDRCPWTDRVGRTACRRFKSAR